MGSIPVGGAKKLRTHACAEFFLCSVKGKTVDSDIFSSLSYVTNFLFLKEKVAKRNNKRGVA